MAVSTSLLPSVLPDAPAVRPATRRFPALLQQESSIRLMLRATAVLIASLHAWADRNVMNADGVSYLDIGDAYMRGDWGDAFNAYSSPMYSWLLGASLAVVKPSMYWEFAAVHAVNLAIFILTLAAFEFFLRQFLAGLRQQPDEMARLPRWAWLVFAYTLFIWSSIQLITITVVSPDLLMAAFVYAATGMLLRIVRGAATVATFAGLGALLGFAYLAKAPMFPLAAVYILLATAAAWRARRESGRALALGATAAVAFVMLAGPYVVALSMQKQRLTFGDSRFITYAWIVNGVPMRHGQSDPEGQYTLVHPTRQVAETPGVYEFAGPVAGTYPVWYDPSYWYEGIQAQFSPVEQARALIESLREYHRLFLGYLRVSLVVGLAILWVIAGRPLATLRLVADQWAVLIPAAAGLAMFALVLTFPRYVAAFVVLLWLGLYATVRLPNTADGRRTLLSVASVVSALLMVATLIQSAPQVLAIGRELAGGDSALRHPHWEVAAALKSSGVVAGDRVAEVHAEPSRASWTGMMSWARLLRVRIVAEVPPEHAADFWKAPEGMRGRAYDAFARAGARAVVAQVVPEGADRSGWQPLADTGYAVRWLDRPLAEDPLRAN